MDALGSHPGRGKDWVAPVSDGLLVLKLVCRHLPAASGRRRLFKRDVKDGENDG